MINELERFLDLEFGLGTWADVRARAGRATPYVITVNYPDEEAMGLVVHAARATDTELQDFLIAFGAFLASGLLKVYAPFIDARWGLLDLLEHTEGSIHEAVRLNDAAADPPRIHVTRPARDQVEINYRSPRRLCGLAKGIVFGLSKHFNAPVGVEDRTCMLAGDAACTIAVSLHTQTNA